MKMRSSKAAGSFDCAKLGSFELLIHIEADPLTFSFCEFDFECELRGDEAREFNDFAAYLLRHQAGLFVVCVEPRLALRSPHVRKIWHELDAALARKGIWLLTTDPKKLRREPGWTNALELARCALSEIDPRDEERVLEYLRTAGRARILEVMKLCRSSQDSFDAILRLIAAGILVCDEEFELSPHSRVQAVSPSTKPVSIAWL